MIRVTVAPELFRWARERSGVAREDLSTKFKKLSEWETGEVQPTLKQVEAFARAVHVPVGYMFLTEPPEESIPIPDFRTIAGRTVTHPSPNLLDTIYSCQERQVWYREFARVAQQPSLDFVSSTTMRVPPEIVAARMRETLEFEVDARRECPTWSDAFRLFARKVNDAGVLVMVSGVVLSNNRRRLDPMEFRGFALSDPLAPLVFVNAADTKAAQMFTLAHELAHLWLGASALSDMGVKPDHLSPGAAALSDIGAEPTHRVRGEELWCNAVAAEFLVPLETLRVELRRDEQLLDAMSRLARAFKVSTLVVLRRLFDAEWIGRETFEEIWRDEIARLRRLAQRDGDGGDFYRTTSVRVGRRFARALVASTLEGQTLHRDAFRMLGISKTETFRNLGREVGVVE